MSGKRIYIVQAIIFDMDGVITNTMPDHFRAWQSVLAEEGVRVSRIDIYRREGQQGLTSIRELCAQFGIECSLNKARQLLKRKEEIFHERVHPRYINGVRSFIRARHREGFALGLVTGTSRGECEKILPTALRRFFQVIVTGNDVTNGKPHPTPYRRALKKLGCPAQHAVVIENAPLGIRSAKAAGCRCLALTTSLPGSALEQADEIFSSFRALNNRLKFIPRSAS